MTAKTARRRRTAEPETVGATLTAYARMGWQILVIGNTEVACTVVEEGGERFVTRVVVDLPGAGGRLGYIQPATEARDRWMVGAGDGWVDAEFPTVLDAVEALSNPKICAAMVEQTELRRQLGDLERRVRALPPIPKALLSS